MVSRKPLKPYLEPLPANDSAFAASDLSLDGLDLMGEEGASQRPADRAYHGIRRAILSGELKSGEHLREELLAQMTGTSRTPVRDALNRLVAEGLATQDGRHRFVADFSFEEIITVFELRSQIEGYAASLAAQRITTAELDRLDAIIRRIDDLAELDPNHAAEQFLRLNTDFHTLIVRATRSSRLHSLIAQTVAVPLTTIKQFVWGQKLNIARSNAQHRDILEALSQRNSEWASLAMTGHVISTKPKALSTAPTLRVAGRMTDE